MVHAIVSLYILLTAVANHVDTQKSYRNGNCDVNQCVTSVNLRISENGYSHHTSQYHLMKNYVNKHLVVRRGSVFRLHVHVKKVFQEDLEKLWIIFKFADDSSPTEAEGTLVRLRVERKKSKTGKTSPGWTATHSAPKRNVLTLSVAAASDAPVGIWNLEFVTIDSLDGRVRYKHPNPIYILFNAWHYRDTVYMEDDLERLEYVLEELGKLWIGETSVRNWDFAQFEQDVLDCALYLVGEIAKLDPKNRGDAVVVSRSISQAANSNQDYGVLVGQWGTFENGTPPSYWKGSLEIVQKYYKAKDPVNYGQCWVFAGLVTTLCRTLGIPARPVTNILSAHDGDKSISLDYYINENKERISEEEKDSMWNFHVWNEVWMTRPDLGPEYDGWQVIDSTPQEDSDGLKRVGPASVYAIKKGDFNQPYDVAFVYTEVNGDLIHWRKNLKEDKHKVPQMISRINSIYYGQAVYTKGVGNTQQVDIVDEYKYPEKSNEERRIFLKMLNSSKSHISRDYVNDQFNDVYMSLVVFKRPKYGDPIHIKVQAENFNKFKSYNITAHILLITTDVSGYEKEFVKKNRVSKMVARGSTQKLWLSVVKKEYEHLYRSTQVVHFLASCIVRMRGQAQDFYAQNTFKMMK